MTAPMAAETKRETLFRSEALAEAEGASRRAGEPLHLSPTWSRATYWVLVLAFAVASVVLVCARVSDYARGSAIVRTGEAGRGDIAPRLVAFLPAHAQPFLHPGMHVRFALDGYAHAYRDLIIADVGTQIVSAAEAKRRLGIDSEEAARLEGSFVLVEATIPGGTFRADDVVFELGDGMTGTAEARLRSERLIVALFPALRALTDPSR